MQTKLSTSYFIFYGEIALQQISCAVKIFVVKILGVKTFTTMMLTVKISNTISCQNEMSKCPDCLTEDTSCLGGLSTLATKFSTCNYSFFLPSYSAGRGVLSPT